MVIKIIVFEKKMILRNSTAFLLFLIEYNILKYC